MSEVAVRWARRQQTGSAKEKATLLILAAESDRVGTCNLSTRRIADEAAVGLATARRALEQLRNRGLISWSPGKGRAANSYQLALPQPP